jgi:glycosyltransferase involved in cell wall biosynthesis
MSKQVLLTVSGTIPADLHERIARGERPRADYLELARGFNADLIDYARARELAGRFGKLLERAGGPDLVLAWACFQLRERYKLIVTDGEQIGLPLAALLKFFSPRQRPRHQMIVHILSVPKKQFFLDKLRVQSAIDRFLVYARRQQQFICDRWSLPKERVPFTPFMVDSAFFSAQAVRPQPRKRPMICAVGLERRDYPTLLQAVEGLDLDVVIAAASPWSKRSDSTAGQHIPANVTVRKFTQFELRQLYADSSFLVMPLEDVDFQAGVTAILEAMAMERAVLCSRTLGQTDVVVEGETGLYVRPGDVTALRATIQTMLADRVATARMGQAGRQLIEREMSLDRYVERLSAWVREELAAALAPRAAPKPVQKESAR